MLEENLRQWVREERWEGRKEGLLEGHRKGLQEGVRQGELEGMQKLVLDLLSQRFGRLSATIRRQVEEISSARKLREMGRRVLVAESLQDLGFNDVSNRHS